MLGETRSGVENGRRRFPVFTPPLTSDVETQLDFDPAIHVPDGVAALVRTRDASEGHVAWADADPTLVALPGHARAGEQHQSRPVGGKEDLKRSQTPFNLITILVLECLVGLHGNGPVLQGDGRIHP